MTDIKHRGVTAVAMTWLTACILAGCASTPAVQQSNMSLQQPNATINSTSRDGATGNTSNSTNRENSSAAANVSDASSVTNTASSNGSVPSSSSRWNTTVADTMRFAERSGTKIPLLAPTEPAFSPTVPYIGAQVSATANQYSVVMTSTDKQLPINSPALSGNVYGDASHMIGSFGAVKAASSAVAKSELYRNPEGSIAPAYQSPPNLPATRIDLGHGIAGSEFGDSSSSPAIGSTMVQWHEGDWTFQVWDGTVKQDVEEAKQIVAYLNTHLLPETYGVFGENIAGDGDHTTAEWVYGNTVYSVFDYHSGLQAAQMAVSMRVYPGGQRKP